MNRTRFYGETLMYWKEELFITKTLDNITEEQIKEINEFILYCEKRLNKELFK